MAVIVPLRIEIARQMARGIVVVLEHQMDRAARLDASRTSAAISSSQSVSVMACTASNRRPSKRNSSEPIKRVFGKEPADLRAAEVDRRPPRRLHVVAKHLRAHRSRQIIPVRSEMIVDDVQEHHQAVPVRGVDQKLEFVGRAVAAFGRKRQHAVIAPVARAREFGDRHQFDGSDAEFGKARQVRAQHRRNPPSKPDMKLVQHRLVPRTAAPFLFAIDRTRGSVTILGPCTSPACPREAGSGIAGAIVQQIAIARPGAAGDVGLEPSIAARRHRQRRSPSMAIDMDFCAGAHMLKCVRFIQSAWRRTTGRHFDALHCDGTLQLRVDENGTAREDAEFVVGQAEFGSAGCALSIRIRPGSTGSGRMKTRSSRHRIEQQRQESRRAVLFRVARRKTKARRSGFFQESSGDRLAFSVEPRDIEDPRSRLAPAMQEMARARALDAPGAARSAGRRNLR